MIRWIGVLAGLLLGVFLAAFVSPGAAAPEPTEKQFCSVDELMAEFPPPLNHAYERTFDGVVAQFEVAIRASGLVDAESLRDLEEVDRVIYEEWADEYLRPTREFSMADAVVVRQGGQVVGVVSDEATGVPIAGVYATPTSEGFRFDVGVVCERLLSSPGAAEALEKRRAERPNATPPARVDVPESEAPVEVDEIEQSDDEQRDD